MSEVNYDILTKPFPKEAIKQRRGNGGIMLNYVSVQDCLRRLIKATGNKFGFKVLAVEIRDGLAMATVELEIDGSKRQHIGTQRINGANDDDAVKASISDAIKKCLTLWGCGLDLAGPDLEAVRLQTAAQARPAQARPVAVSPTQARPALTQQQVRTASGAPVNRAVAMAGSRTFRQA